MIFFYQKTLKKNAVRGKEGMSKMLKSSSGARQLTAYKLYLLGITKVALNYILSLKHLG